MKLIDEIDQDKLRGGFYTPPALVDFCLDRGAELLGGSVQRTRVLEPSAGDGAFLRGLERCPHFSEAEVIAIERDPTEADRCRAGAREGVDVITDSFFSWADASDRQFDLLVGNPPFVRYQFVPPKDRTLAEWLTRWTGIPLSGVANLWIPFAIVGLGRLRTGGAFALVLPAELLSTSSAAQFRRVLIERCQDLQIDLFPRETFPDLLQDVVVVSGRRSTGRASVAEIVFQAHEAQGVRRWSHHLAAREDGWTRFLLTRAQLDALDRAAGLPEFHRLGELARLTVSTVTGANPFFTLDAASAEEWEVGEWCRPLLARTAGASGLRFAAADHDALRESGARCWLLDFSADRAPPRGRALAYLARGEQGGLPERYKCRVRTPWFRVPVVEPGELLLSKRAHQHHRLLLNTAGVVTTDTIYRGALRGEAVGAGEDLVAGFHNALTLLTIELEGRSYGGGVIELVPSEIARVLAPLVSMGEELDGLDALSRATDGQKDREDRVSFETDRLLSARVPAYAELVDTLVEARLALRGRRRGITSGVAPGSAGSPPEG